MLQRAIIYLSLSIAFVGLASGLIAQIELLQADISLLSISALKSLWGHLLLVHVWATSIAILLCTAATLTSLRSRASWFEWSIWFGLSSVLILAGLFLQFAQASFNSPDNIFADTVYVSAYRHAYGVAVLMIALGGASGWMKAKGTDISRLVSLMFAACIMLSGLSFAYFQYRLGLMGMPRSYADYPVLFEPFQLRAGISAIVCFGLSLCVIARLFRAERRMIKNIQSNVVGAF